MPAMCAVYGLGWAGRSVVDIHQLESYWWIGGLAWFYSIQIEERKDFWTGQCIAIRCRKQRRKMSAMMDNDEWHR
jgi:hypothetical protein